MKKYEYENKSFHSRLQIFLLFSITKFTNFFIYFWIENFTKRINIDQYTYNTTIFCQKKIKKLIDYRVCVGVYFRKFKGAVCNCKKGDQEQTQKIYKNQNFTLKIYKKNLFFSLIENSFCKLMIN